MEAQNRTQELEALLNGRSILDLAGEEAAMAVELLTQVVKSKSLESFTEVEYKALIEELAEDLAINMFKADLPADWKRQALHKIENSNERKWGWSFASILDEYLNGVEMWDALDADDAEKVAKAIMDYLEVEGGDL